MVRIIARLDIKGPNLVKGIQLEGLRVLGDPHAFAKVYYEKGIDEIIYQDTVASLYNRNSLLDLISKTAKDIFIPITVGGGIRTLEDINRTLKAGADRVSINTAAIRNPQFIHEASLKFGKSTIVASIEAIKNQDGKYYAFTDNGREASGIEVLSWAKELERLGAGEIMITSVLNEGSGLGLDTQLVKLISKNVSIPIIAHGGAGKKEHFKEIIQIGDCNAVAAASFFHYNYLTELSSPNTSSEGNKIYISKPKKYLNFEHVSIFDLKSFLRENKINQRIE